MNHRPERLFKRRTLKHKPEIIGRIEGLSYTGNSGLVLGWDYGYHPTMRARRTSTTSWVRPSIWTLREERWFVYEGWNVIT